MIETHLALALKIRDIYVYNPDEITGQTLISHQRQLRKKGKNLRKNDFKETGHQATGQ